MGSVRNVRKDITPHSSRFPIIKCLSIHSYVYLRHDDDHFDGDFYTIIITFNSCSLAHSRPTM